MAFAQKRWAGLARSAANETPLSPLSFLRRTARVWPDKTAVIDADRRVTWAEFADRARRLAGLLTGLGVIRGDVVAVLAPNVPVILEAHFGIPLAGAVINPLNTRLDGPALAFILEHSEAKVLLVHSSLARVAREALVAVPGVTVVEVSDGAPALPGALDYETALAAAPLADWRLPEDEWEPIAVNYTSGTTGNPKGVVLHHRGAYLASLGNMHTLGLRHDSVYLWTLPAFHCNGWSGTWAVAAAGAAHVCLPRVEPKEIYRLIAAHGVTHLCAAPVVLTMLLHAPEEHVIRPARPVLAGTGGAAPSSTTLRLAEDRGFSVLHMYGMTESYGPTTLCAEQPAWAEAPADRVYAAKARQGVPLVQVEDATVLDAAGQPVAADGETLGEVAFRGNGIMLGYLKNPEATAESLRDGWLFTGDLGVLHPDGYVEVKDRAKDIIISGGENISSLEVEEALTRHPAVLEAAVVAEPHPFWGETPTAFVTLKPGAAALDEAALIAWTRDHLAHFKAPTRIVFQELPKTATGKIQKQVLRALAKDHAARVAAA